MADKRSGRARQGTHPKAPRPTIFSGGTAIYRTNSGQAAQKVLSQAADRGQRVSVKVVLRNGEVSEAWRNPGHGRGISASFLRQQRLEDKRANPRYVGRTAGGLKAALARAAIQGDPAASDSYGKPFEIDDIQEIQITAYPA